MKTLNTNPGERSGPLQFPQRHPLWTGLPVLVLLLILLFDWNWFKGPLERYISRKTERSFQIADLHVRLGLTPTIRMRNVYFANAAWSRQDAMARIEMLEFSVSLRDLPEKILLPRVVLTRPALIFEQHRDGRRNWILAHPSERAPGKIRVSTLSVDQGRLQYFNHGESFFTDITANTFEPAGGSAADAKPPNGRYSTRYTFSGKYHDAAFSGHALTGEIISLQQSGRPFPIKGQLVASTTRLEVEGDVADVATISGLDAQVRIEGKTMASLYPFLLLPLPESPPYRLQGRLILQGERYTMDDLRGRIGSTDVRGRAAYLARKPRPLMTAQLRSDLLDLNDLGPLIGVQNKESARKPAITQARTSTLPEARAKETGLDPDTILPAGRFDGGRLQKIDAEVGLEARRLKVPIALPLESLRGSLRLHNAILKLDSLEFGFAGGLLSAQATLDARQPTIRSDVRIHMRRVRVDRLVPDNPALAKGAGLLGASVQLQGAGNSIADAAATADGEISLAIANGRLSNLLDAGIGLNGGKVLSLLLGGDRDIAVNCGGVTFDVKDGRGTARLFLVDTEQTQIEGKGGFDLERETFAFTVIPKPKHRGILSLRTPLRLHGTFRNPDFEFEKGPLLARAAGVLALTGVAPLAALIPLIETGPGEDSNCDRVKYLAGSAEQQAFGVPRTGAPGKKSAPPQAASQPAKPQRPGPRTNLP